MSCGYSINTSKCTKSIGGVKRAFVSRSKPVIKQQNAITDSWIVFLGAQYGAPYYELSINNDSISITTEISVNDEVGNTSYTTNIVFKQPDMLTEIISDYAQGEFSLIVQDFQNRYYIVGHNNLCKLSTGTVTSGAQLSDYNGYELTYTTTDIPTRIISSELEYDNLAAEGWVDMENIETLVFKQYELDNVNKIIWSESITPFFNLETVNVTSTEDEQNNTIIYTVSAEMAQDFDTYTSTPSLKFMGLGLADTALNYEPIDLTIHFPDFIPVVNYFKEQGETGYKTLLAKNVKFLLYANNPNFPLEGNGVVFKSGDYDIFTIKTPEMSDYTTTTFEIDVTVRMVYDFETNYCTFYFDIPDISMYRITK